MRFSPLPPKYSDEPYDERFTAALGRFALELARNGLTLEAGARTFFENGEFVLQVIAQDDEAIDERNMSYDTKKALEALVKRCRDVPSVAVLRGHIHPANCEGIYIPRTASAGSLRILSCSPRPNGRARR